MRLALVKSYPQDTSISIVYQCTWMPFLVGYEIEPRRFVCWTC